MGPRPKLNFFSKYGHVAYHIKVDDFCSNMIANILPKDTPSTHGMGSKGQTIYFCESSHVAYQITGNGAQSIMKVNMLSLHTQTTPGVGSKGQTIYIFVKVVMLHIKLKGMEHRAP